MRRPLVYVAGPITGNPWGCVRQATDAFGLLRHLGAVPFLPQLSVLHEMVDPQPYEAWLAYDHDVIRHCDALVRLEGESKGADGEVAFALSLGVPVFDADGNGWDEFMFWMADREASPNQQPTPSAETSPTAASRVDGEER